MVPRTDCVVPSSWCARTCPVLVRITLAVRAKETNPLSLINYHDCRARRKAESRVVTHLGVAQAPPEFSLYAWESHVPIFRCRPLCPRQRTAILRGRSAVQRVPVNMQEIHYTYNDSYI
ncbi:hypothetical protein BaRGS_00034485 [Batillaria attramentaria]|uniref:Uncharacterized protein n=1 Tax=Batillaria attramentaria TaxID=370345 RepID=A0ABD0JH63_9CAEN